MKKLMTCMIVAAALALFGSGCRNGNRSPSFDTAMLNAMGSQSNRVMTVVQGGRQASSMFDKESVLPAFAETAREAIKAGQEVSISSGVYGGLRGAKIDKSVDRDTLVQDGVSKVVAASLMTAKNGGAPTDAAASLFAAGGKSIFEGMTGGDDGPASDESGLQFLTLSAGPDANKYHSENVRAGFATRQAVALADRPSMTSVEKIVEKDITTSNAWNAITTALILSSERDQDSEDAGKPFVDDPLTYGTQPATPDKPATFGNGTLGRVRSWYPSTSLGGGNTDAIARGVGHVFLWKPVSESNGKLAIHTPNDLHVTSITVGEEKKSTPDGIGNGYRPLWRFSKPGSAYGAPVRVTLNIADGRSHVVTVPNGGQRWSDDLPISTPVVVEPMPTPADPPIVPPNVIGPGTTTPPAGGDAAAPGESPAP